LKEMREMQKAMKTECEPCFDCKHIAIKLGIEPIK
jgi:hypothetical protein